MAGTWVRVVETLSKVAVKHPQSAYAGFTFCLQHEWHYDSFVVMKIAHEFAPVEWDIQKNFFLPALTLVKLTLIATSKH